MLKCHRCEHGHVQKAASTDVHNHVCCGRAERHSGVESKLVCVCVCLRVCLCVCLCACVRAVVVVVVVLVLVLGLLLLLWLLLLDVYT